MSGRGRRGRGRPPKSASFSTRPNLLKKPRYLFAGSAASIAAVASRTFDESPLSSTPASGRRPYRGRLRENKAQKVRKFLRDVFDSDDDEDDRDVGDGVDVTSEESDYDRDDDDDDEVGVPSDGSYESDEASVLSHSSYSTISSVTPARRRWTRRPTTPVFLQDREFPPLTLPKSSEDLLLPRDHLMQALGIYEILRRFRNILRLTPFRFEDFCAALISEEQCVLLADIHVMLLKAILREEDAANTMFGAQDQKDSINIHYFFLDNMTWPEVLRLYLESDPEYYHVLPVFNNCEYPFTHVGSKLRVLQFLCDQFLTTSLTREEVTCEGLIRHDDHCRVCHKLGDLLCCETCSAVFHLACLDPPLEEVPSEDWICAICRGNQVAGVTECISEIEKTGLLNRQEPLGLDRHGRKYWFLCRRVFVETDEDTHYYSTKIQLQELLNLLDPMDLESDLCRLLNELRDDIFKQMDITEKLTNGARGNRKSYLEIENVAVTKMLEEQAAKKQREEEERMRKLAEEHARKMHEENKNSDDEDEDESDESKKDKTENIDKSVDQSNLDVLVESNVTLPSILEESEEKLKKDAAEGTEDSTDTKTKDEDEKGKLSGVVTRSKTGSLQPRTFNIDLLTNRSTNKRLAEDLDSYLVINRDGEITKVTRTRANTQSSLLNPANGGPVIFKLGMESNYKSYNNQFTSNTLALNKHQHAEDRDKKRHLSHKFSLTSASDFKWHGATTGTRSLCITTLRQTMLQLENNVPSSIMHPNWAIHRNNWLKAVNMSNTANNFSLALNILESVLKPVLFNPVWSDALGHTRLRRTTALEREERKKQEKRDRRDNAEEESDRRMWVKYTLGLKHQVYKQKGEEYRITGHGGWTWYSCTRVPKIADCREMGLRAGPHKVVITLKGGQGGAKVIDAKAIIRPREVSKPVGSQDGTSSSQDGSGATEPKLEGSTGDIADPEKTEAKKQMTLADWMKANPLAFLLKADIPLIDVSASLTQPIRVIYPKIAKVGKMDVYLDRRVKMKMVEDKAKEGPIKKETTVKTENVEQNEDKNVDVESVSPVKIKNETVEKIATAKEKVPLNSVKAECNAEFNSAMESVIVSNKDEDLMEVEVVSTPAEKEKPLMNGDITLGLDEESMEVDADVPEFLRACYSPLCQSVGKNFESASHECYSPSCLALSRANSKNSTVDKLFESLKKPSPLKKEQMEERNRKSIEENTDKEPSLADGIESPSEHAYASHGKNSKGSLPNGSQKSDECKKSKTKEVPSVLSNNSIGTAASAKEQDTKTETEKSQTSGKVSLQRGMKMLNKKMRKVSRGGLPPSSKFVTPKRKTSIMILPSLELQKLARKGSHREVYSFSYQAKPNQYSWPYGLCPRPAFKTCWRYRNQLLKSIHAAALQLRVLWSCIKWDDLQTKPPPGGTNTVTTENEVQTIELLKRRDIGPLDLRSEFLIRKITVPIDLPTKPREKVASHRSGLRERRRPESPMNKGPTVTEVWIPEEELELWEIKQFGDKFAKQQLASKEKAVQNQMTTEKIKSHLEQQLKNQRLVLQQKRLEPEKTIVTTTPTASTLTFTNQQRINSPITFAKTITKAITVTMSPNVAGNIVSGVNASNITSLSPSALNAVLAKAGKAGITNIVAAGGAASNNLKGVKRIFASKGNKDSNANQTVTLTSAITGGTATVKLPISAALFPKPNQLLIRPNSAATPISSMGTAGIVGNNNSPLSFVASPLGTTTIPTASELDSARPTVLTVRGVMNPTGLQQPTPQASMVQNTTPTAAVRPAQITVIQTPNGQYQVRGLLPGQQLIKLSDGRLQLLTVPGQQNIATNQTASQPQPIQLAPMRPTISVAAPATVTTTATISTGAIPISAGSSPLTFTIPNSIAGTPLAAAMQAGTVQLVTTQGGQTAFKIQAPAGIPGNRNISPKLIQIRPLVQPQVTVAQQVFPGQVKVTNSVGAVGARSLVSTNQVRFQGNTVTIPGIGTVVTTPVSSASGNVTNNNQNNPASILNIAQKVATNANQATSILNPRTVCSISNNAASKTPSTPTKMTKAEAARQAKLAKLGLTPTTPTKNVPVAIAPNAVVKTEPPSSPIATSSTLTSPPGSPQQQFVLTPAITQQIVRQALMNPSTTPEIQQKLLALQRHHQQQMQKQTTQPAEIKPAPPSTSSSVSHHTPIAVATPAHKSSVIAERSFAKTKTNMTPEMREDSQRVQVCQQVLKNLLDKIEKEEKNLYRKQRQKESAEERKFRASTNKLTALLFKHTELLRKDIMKKRALVEKELQIDIQNELQNELRKWIPLSSSSTNSNIAPQPIVVAVGSGTAMAVGNHSLLARTLGVDGGTRNVRDKDKPLKKRKSHSSESGTNETFDIKPPKSKKQKMARIGAAFIAPGKIRRPTQKLYCICKKPYDSTKLMLSCDLCSNWFHIECIGVSEPVAKTMDKYICSECNKEHESTSGELYCLCRQPYDESQFYICCDRCQDWFHGRCVGVLQSEADSIDEYICPNCQSNTNINHANLKVLEEKDFENLKKLLKSLQVHKMSWPFREPVDPKEAPDYYKVIKEPMDLKKIEQKLTNSQYTRLADFISDMTKIFDNCRYYNPRNSPFYQCAEVLESYFVQKIKTYRENIT